MRPVLDNIAGAAERRDGDSLLCWHVTLTGLVNELANILAAGAVVAGDDGPKN